MSDHKKIDHQDEDERQFLEKLVEDVVEEVLAPEPVPEPTVPDKKVQKKKTPAVATQLNVSGLSVSQEKIVFESVFERNSRTIGLIQIRLIELGYMSAGGDKRGWFSAGTKQAFDEFIDNNAFSGNYADREVLESLFSGTKVEIIL
jgi:hypothetical protein